MTNEEIVRRFVYGCPDLLVGVSKGRATLKVKRTPQNMRLLVNANMYVLAATVDVDNSEMPEPPVASVYRPVIYLDNTYSTDAQRTAIRQVAREANATLIYRYHIPLTVVASELVRIEDFSVRPSVEILVRPTNPAHLQEIPFDEDIPF